MSDSSNEESLSSDSRSSSDENERTLTLERDSMLKELKEFIINARESDVQSSMRCQVYRPTNRQMMPPIGNIEPTLDDKGIVSGFKLKITQSDASLRSIKSSKYVMGTKTYPENFPHDYVLKAYIEEGDAKLKDAFPRVDDGGDDLTPDLIEKVGGDQIIVMELATRMSNTPKSMEQAYKEKLIKYRHHLCNREGILNDRVGADPNERKERIMVRFCILVVSLDKVVTNVPLSQDHINELCMRYRFAVGMQPRLAERNLVRVPDSELDSEASKIRMMVSNFDLTKHVSDDDLMKMGFPEYTRDNYVNNIMKPLDEGLFASDMEKLVKKSVAESGLLDPVETPDHFLKVKEKNMQIKMEELRQKKKEYLDKMTNNDFKVSKKRLINYPFLNLLPNGDDSYDGISAVEQSLRESLSEGFISATDDKSSVHSTISEEKKEEELLYLTCWVDAMGSLKEKTGNGNDPERGGCPFDHCDNWQECKAEDERDEGDGSGDEEVERYCHDLESALYHGGVDKAYNDRRSYKRVKIESLDSRQRLLLAAKGVQGKSLSGDEYVKSEREESKKPISFDSSTKDVEDYLSGWVDLSTVVTNESPMSFDAIEDLVTEASKLYSSRNLSMRCMDWVRTASTTKIGLSCYIASSIFLEINASIKQHCKKDEFILKRLREFPVWILIKPTNSASHIFYSILWSTQDSISIFTEDDSRLGTTKVYAREIKLNDDFRCTPFLSVNKSKLPNLCQSFPRLINVMSYAFDDAKLSPIGEGKDGFYSEVFDVSGEDQNLDDLREKESKFKNAFNGSKDARIRKFWKTVLFTLLVSLHNKAEVEEHLTLSRFVFMEGFVEFPAYPNPGKMIEKFSEKIRSRLTIFVIKKLFDLIEHILVKGGFKMRTDEIIGSRRKMTNRQNMRNFFIDEWMDDEGEAINSFYLGYAVDKNQQPESNMTGQLYEKILELEDLFKPEDVGVIGVDEPEDITKVPFHHYSMNLIKGMAQSAGSMISKKYNQDYKAKCEESFLNLYKRKTIFDTMATMKASTEFGPVNESPDSELPKRGKLIKVAKDKIYSGKVFMHEIFMESLMTLLSSMSIYNDLFKKNQHGGLREIYIMNDDTRVIQHFIETCSRSICSLFYSETMTNPDSKVHLLREHSDLAKEKFKGEETRTMCTSDDARKWNQGHYVHKFYVMLCWLLPIEYHEVIRAICLLWQNKKILINEDLLICFKKNPDARFRSEILNKMKDVYRGEAEPTHWMENGSRYIKVRTGMMQGILHYTSSLFHTIVNEFIREKSTKIIQEVVANDPEGFLKNSERMRGAKGKTSSKYSEPVITVMQSSDDSAMIITGPVFDGLSVHIMSYLCLMCFKLKHNLGASVGIYLSPKSTTNTMNILEFNSVWYFLGNRFQPYIKQCLASLTISEHSNLLMRMMENYNSITSALENGASSLNCYGQQIAQAYQHYFFIGATMTHNFLHYSKMMLQLRLPTLGFFLMDHPSVCGIPGFECLHYMLAKMTEVKHYYKRVFEKCAKVKDLEEKRRVINEDTVAPNLHNSICQINHGQNSKLSRLKEFMDLPEDWLETVNADPAPLVRRANNSDEAKLKVAAKLHTPGISSSFNSPSSFSNIAAESVYILTSKCNVIQSPSSMMDMSDYKDILTASANKKWLAEREAAKRTKETILGAKGGEKLRGKEGLLVSAESSEEKSDKMGRVKKFSLLSIVQKMIVEKEALLVELKMMRDEDRMIEEEESQSYLRSCFAKHEDYNLIIDNVNAIRDINLYRDDKTLRNRFLSVKVSAGTLDESLKPYDIVVMKLLGERSIKDHRAAEYSWRLLKKKYTWLKDNWEETLLASPFTDAIQLLNFLSRLDKSAREVRLQGVSMFELVPGDQITNLIGCNLSRGFSTKIERTDVGEESSKEGGDGENDADHDTKQFWRQKNQVTVRIGSHYLMMCSLLPMSPEAKNDCLLNISDKVVCNDTLVSKRLRAFNILFGFSSGQYSAKKVLQMCEEKNIGLIGGYTTPQKFDAVTMQYYDYGVWEGAYEGTGIKILIISRRTSDEIPASELVERKKKAEERNTDVEGGFRIKLRHRVKNFVAKIITSKEIPPKELSSLMERWCETNHVTNDCTWNRTEYMQYQRNKLGLKWSKSTVYKADMQEEPGEVMVGYLNNFNYSPKVGTEVIGARVFIDRNYKKIRMMLDAITDEDMVVSCSEKGTFRLNLKTARGEDEVGMKMDQGRGYRETSKRSRTSFTILSITPSVKDLLDKYSLLHHKKIKFGDPLLDKWTDRSPLTREESVNLLSGIVNPCWSDPCEAKDSGIDGKKIIAMARSMLSRWLIKKDVKKALYVESSGEENVDRRTTIIVEETKLNTGVSTNEWLLTEVGKMKGYVLELWNDKMKSEAEKSGEEGFNGKARLKEWLIDQQEMLYEFDSSVEVGGSRVEMMDREDIVCNHPLFHAFFSSVTIDDWVTMLKANTLPSRLREEKLIFEELLSTEDVRVVLKEIVPSGPQHFPMLRQKKAPKKKFVTE
uniref:RNA-dependent RNA polymerase n=1 Tax=Pink bollworm virus 3 TaxID=2713148 RepID=A0A6G6C943_9VIRU|nr:RNA-dependent RNA polymerase [Pink bollworm virus 3]